MERAKAIYDYAIDLEPKEREEFLQQISTQDPELLKQVRTMLSRADADTEELTPRRETAAPAAVLGQAYIFAPGEMIGDRYRVLRAIARGGMGEVYEVEDLELHSRVALKVISLKSAAKPNAAEMFRREITLARQVTHPNVCRIYDIGHHDHPKHGDLLFLTMEFLEGRTLADRIRTQGTLSKEEALPLLRQMIDALAAAHRLNIAHRDFKTANVILCQPPVASDSGSAAAGSAATSKSASGDAVNTLARNSADDAAIVNSATQGSKNVLVKVTDFGLARSVDGVETTLHNEIWGTPDYMAPEQFRGHSSTASDIYALGVVIYEMFTAKLPHRSSTGPVGSDGKPSATMELIPKEWRPVVKKCMAYEAVDRYANVEDVWQALSGDQLPGSAGHGMLQVSRKVLAGSAAVLLFAIGLTGWINRDAVRRIFHPLPEPKHIAVLPFESIGGDADATAFSEGIGETLTSKLTQLQRFQKAFWVVPFSDSRKRHDVEDAYRRLNVNLVVTGSTQRTKDSVKVTANLIDARTHQQLGSRIMTASVGNLDVLQDRVWQSVADMVDAQVDQNVKGQLERGDTRQPSAYDFYVQGQGYLQHYTLDNMDKAADMFSKSAAIDANYALAYAGLANAYANKYRIAKNSEWIEKAKFNAERAAKIDSDIPYVQVTLGKVYKHSGKYTEALASFRRAYDTDPNQVDVAHQVAEVYEAQGKLSDAEEMYKSVINNHSGYWSGYSGLGSFYFRHGQFDKAARQFQTVIDLVPDDPLGYQNLGAVYLSLGRYDEAIAKLKVGLQKNDSPSVWNNLASAYVYAGRYSEAVDAAKHATNAQPHNDIYWRNLGDAYHQISGKAADTNAAYQHALEAAADRIRVNPNDAQAIANAALYNAHLGRAHEAQLGIAEALKLQPADSEVLFTSALVYEIIGQREKAMAAIGNAYRAGYSMINVQHEPELKKLRTDPRFKDLAANAASAPMGRAT
jgi:serine/threonine protein kinase/tetratricopeptide (TPR) repeat protein